jgi:hypothetical protein
VHRRLRLLLLCGLAPLAVVTGCGGSASPAGKSPTTTHAASTSATSTVPLAVKIREAIAACRKQVSRSPYIPAGQKPLAQADCNGIKTGNISSLKAILRQACLNAVAKLPAADQPPAAAACKKVY